MPGKVGYGLVMIKVIEGLKAGVIGAEAHASVTADDYESTLIPLIESAIKEHGKIRFLYVIDPDFTDISCGALWDDTKVGMQHCGDFERIAMVSDSAMLRGAMKFFGHMMPGDVKTFEHSQLDEAKAWVQA